MFFHIKAATTTSKTDFQLQTLPQIGGVQGLPGDMETIGEPPIVERTMCLSVRQFLYIPNRVWEEIYPRKQLQKPAVV